MNGIKYSTGANIKSLKYSCRLPRRFSKHCWDFTSTLQAKLAGKGCTRTVHSVRAVCTISRLRTLPCGRGYATVAMIKIEGHEQ